jgi:hypothetical protein
MNTLLITADHIKNGLYVGPDLSDFDGNVEFAADLGWVKIDAAIRVSGCLVIKAGTSIEAGDLIKAGGLIKAGDWIEAGDRIEAGDWIEAGGWIEAKKGISAGLWIAAKTVSANLKIFVGICVWRETLPEERQLRAKLLNGELAHGEYCPPSEEVAA